MSYWSHRPYNDNEAVDDFDEFDPTPYGGGYDIQLTYGRPVKPSEETCYNISSGGDASVDSDRPNYSSHSVPSAYADEALKSEYSSYSRGRGRRPSASGGPGPAHGFQPGMNRPGHGGEEAGSGYGRKPEYEDRPRPGSEYGRKPEYEERPRPGSEYGRKTEYEERPPHRSEFERKPEYEERPPPRSEFGRKPEYEERPPPRSEHESGYGRRTEHEEPPRRFGIPEYGGGGEEEPPRRYGRPEYGGGEEEEKPRYGRRNEEEEKPRYGSRNDDDEEERPRYGRRNDDDDERPRYGGEEGHGRKKYGGDDKSDEDEEKRHHHRHQHHRKSYDDE